MALHSVSVIKDCIIGNRQSSSWFFFKHNFLQINVLWFLLPILLQTEPPLWEKQMWGPEDTVKQIVLLLTITQNWGFTILKCVFAGANWAYCFQQKNNIFHDQLSFLILLYFVLPCCHTLISLMSFTCVYHAWCCYRIPTPSSFNLYQTGLLLDQKEEKNNQRSPFPTANLSTCTVFVSYS
jgi:hypothetical protein